MEVLSKVEIISGKIEMENKLIELDVKIKEVDGCPVDEEKQKIDKIFIDLEKLSIAGKEKRSGKPIEITCHRNNRGNPIVWIKVKVNEE